MSGGVAYVYDKDRHFADRCNLELVDLEQLSEADEEELKELISEHVARTGSMVGRNVLASWERGARERFVKVMPRDYRRALEERAERERAGGRARSGGRGVARRGSRHAQRRSALATPAIVSIPYCIVGIAVGHHRDRERAAVALEPRDLVHQLCRAGRLQPSLKNTV